MIPRIEAGVNLIKFATAAVKIYSSIHSFISVICKVEAKKAFWVGQETLGDMNLSYCVLLTW